MSRSLAHLTIAHLTLTTSAGSLSPTTPIFQSFLPSHPSPLAHDPYTLRDSRWSGGSTQIPIEPEDFEPRRIELDRNLGTEPYETQERMMVDNYQNPIIEDQDEFGKVGVELSHLQSKIHSDYESAASIADSDLEDGE